MLNLKGLAPDGCLWGMDWSVKCLLCKYKDLELH